MMSLVSLYRLANLHAIDSSGVTIPVNSNSPLALLKGAGQADSPGSPRSDGARYRLALVAKHTTSS